MCYEADRFIVIISSLAVVLCVSRGFRTHGKGCVFCPWATCADEQPLSLTAVGSTVTPEKADVPLVSAAACLTSK